MRTLTIDMGNSRVKHTVLVDGVVTSKGVSLGFDIDAVRQLISAHSIDGVAVSSVRGEMAGEVSRGLKSMVKRCLVLDSATALPIAIGYSTPHTLGRDRVATAVGAATLVPGENVLVVDAGTAVTLDFVTADGVFVGGNISLGLGGRFRALHEFTAALPLVSHSEGDVPLLGYDTATAIRSGVVLGLLAEIDGFIAKVEAERGSTKVMLTGGDAEFLAERLEHEVTVEPDLLALGLNRILSYNENI